jgi:hypothetical protein
MLLWFHSRDEGITNGTGAVESTVEQYEPHIE